MNSDRVWLGDLEPLGPFVRAGLGILLAQGDWTWWHHPGAASTVMINAIRTSGLAVWGGDAAVLTAHEWLDANTAIEVGNGFKTLVARRGADLKIKIHRCVYSWGSEYVVEAVIADLEKAFTRQQVFAEWPISRRPRRPSKDPGLDSLTVSSSHELRASAEQLAVKIDGAKLKLRATVASIAVGTPDYILSAHCSADLVILVGDNKSDAIMRLDAIRVATGAQAALYLPSNLSSGKWFTVLGESINKGASIPEAVVLANHTENYSAEFLAVTQQFIFNSRKFIFPRRTTISKARLADGIEDVALSSSGQKNLQSSTTTPYSNLEIDGIRMQALPPVIRMLRAVAHHDKKIVDYFPPAGPISVSVSIGPISPLESATLAFPDHKLKWDHHEVRLQVHKVQVGSPTDTRQITVPRTGASEPVEFALAVIPDQEVDIRFIVAEGARILQTSRLQGAPSGKIQFYIESMSTAVDRPKETFDLALLVNDSLGDRPSATVLTKTGIRLELLEDYAIAAARDELRGILESCVNDPAKPLNPMLFDLANRGKLIFDSLKQHTPGWPDRLDRVQLTTQGDKFFPLEYLYDGKIPDNHKSGLCTDRKTCLTNGSAKEGCEIKSAGQQLCPMGFLGISAIIERQTWDRKMDKATWLRQARDPENRTKITSLNKMIFAAANKADHFSQEDVAQGFDIVKIRDIEDHTGDRQPNWEEWKSQVLAVQPNLIVLLPHIENCCMYIGEDEILAFAAVNEVHLGRAEPVVIAMGCNSAVAFTAAAGLPAALLRCGARIVVAALTGILGRYANIATRDLTATLISAAASHEPTSIGTILNELRRRFLANDNPLGMVIVAFGDADYLLGGSESEAGKNV